MVSVKKFTWYFYFSAHAAIVSKNWNSFCQRANFDLHGKNVKTIKNSSITWIQFFFSINSIVTFWLTFPRGYWITLTFVIWLHYFWIRFVACCSTGIQGVMSICFNRIGKKQKNDVQLSSSWPCLHFMTRLFVNRIEHFLEQVGSLTLLSFWNNMQVIRK